MIRTIFKNVYGRFVKRKVQEFNVENRAHKFLDQDKLPIAPRHFNEEKNLNKLLKDHPDVKEDVNKKHEELVDNMGKVKIVVTYPPELKSQGKKLPKERSIIPKDVNFKVDKIPAGCIDFEIFLRIYDYKYNHFWTNEEIADEFDLDVNNVDDLLFYFKPYNNKIIDKKIYLQNSNHWQNRTYVKIAEILNRDVETFEEIPEYKRELQKIEEANKSTEIEEHKTKDQLIMEEEFEDFEKRMDQMKFKELNFFIANEAKKNEENDNSMNKKSKDDKSKDHNNSQSNKTSNKNNIRNDKQDNKDKKNIKKDKTIKSKKEDSKKDKTSSDDKKSKLNSQKKDIN